MVTELRNRHAAGITSAGINVRQGIVADMWAMKVIQPLLVNTSEISLATECVGMILKIGESSYHLPVRKIVDHNLNRKCQYHSLLLT